MLERVIGAGVEEPLPDLWLAVPAHPVIFSRNKPYVYRWRPADQSKTRRS